MNQLYTVKTTKHKQKLTNPNLFERAQYGQDLTLEIANALSFAAIGENDAESEAVADLIEESANDENIFVAEDIDFIDKKTGKRKFIDSCGSLNVVSSRCSPAYLKTQSARGRKSTRTALAMVKPQSGEKLRFIVLTQPDMFGFDFFGAYELLSGAMVRLKNHPYFKKNFRGGAFTYEFTLGAENTHFHLHANILGYTKWLDFDELRRVWTDCLRKTARDMGRELVVNTKDGLANIKIKAVKPKVRNAGKEITLDDAITECVKYVVKGSDFAKIPTEFICQVEKALYRKRLVETFGEANKRKGKTKANNERQYVHKNHTIQDSLDTALVTSAPLPVANHTRKRETLRQTGARMIRAGRREEWKALIRRIFAERAAFRKIKLAQRYKYAIFCTLAGEIWRGVCVSDERFYEYKIAAYGDSAFAY
jgi:hypothetical protein